VPDGGPWTGTVMMWVRRPPIPIKFRVKNGGLSRPVPAAGDSEEMVLMRWGMPLVPQA
jgi:hypothetical protein